MCETIGERRKERTHREHAVDAIGSGLLNRDGDVGRAQTLREQQVETDERIDVTRIRRGRHRERPAGIVVAGKGQAHAAEHGVRVRQHRAARRPRRREHEHAAARRDEVGDFCDRARCVIGLAIHQEHIHAREVGVRGRHRGVHRLQRVAQRVDEGGAHARALGDDGVRLAARRPAQGIRHAHAHVARSRSPARVRISETASRVRVVIPMSRRDHGHGAVGVRREHRERRAPVHHHRARRATTAGDVRESERERGVVGGDVSAHLRCRRSQKQGGDHAMQLG